MNPIRFSRLKRMARSPLHFYAAPDDAETSSLRLGSAVHAYAFGGPSVVTFDGVRRGRAWDAFKAEYDGSIILSAREREQAQGMSRALKDNEHAMRLFSAPGAVREETLHWQLQGLPCRGTPDLVTARYIVDLKTTRYGEPSWFAREAIRRAYHAQLSWYMHGVLQSHGQELQSAYIVAVESSPPYPVVVHRLTERALERGERLWRLWFERLTVCERSNHWPGYTEAIVDLDIPDDDELDLTFGEDAA